MALRVSVQFHRHTYILLILTCEQTLKPAQGLILTYVHEVIPALRRTHKSLASLQNAYVMLSFSIE